MGEKKMDGEPGKLGAALRKRLVARLREINRLLKQAREAAQAGDMKKAKSLLERAEREKSKLIVLLNQVLHPDFSFWHGGLNNVNFLIGFAERAIGQGMSAKTIANWIRLAEFEKKILERKLGTY